MRSDFEPLHLQQANAKLEKYLLSSKRYKTDDESNQDGKNKISVWKKFLKLLTTNPFVLPEEFYK